MSSSSPPQIPDRFSEDKAAYALRGIGQPDIEAGVAAIRDTVKTLTLQPGVYRMVDARGDVLYVGKAKALKNRVTNYTQIMRLPKRLQRMVAQTRSMTIVTTSTEAEALLLEAQLIKRYRPPYNVLLRDDKSFPFILLRTDHAFARLTKHRGARRAEGHYFGPFAGAGAVNTTINALQKLFLLRSCSDSFMARRDRPCLLYQIKRCSAPCVGRIAEGDYAALVAEAKEFLSGRSGAVQARLQAQMEGAAEGLDFERAAMLRDRLRAATFIQGSQAVNAEGLGDADVFAVAAKGGQVAVQAFFIRGGQNWGHRAFFPFLGSVQQHAVPAIGLLPFHLYALAIDAVHPFAHIVRLDRQFPAEAAIDEHHELNTVRSAETEHRVQPRTDAASGVQHIVDQHHALAIEAEVQFRGAGRRGHRAMAEIIAVEGDVQFAVRDVPGARDALQFLLHPAGEQHSARLQSDQRRA